MSTEGSYFDQMSTQLESTVGAQMSGVVSGVSENSEAGMSPSVNALDTGLKGQACLPVSKQLAPVIGVDIHLVNIPPPAARDGSGGLRRQPHIPEI